MKPEIVAYDRDRHADLVAQHGKLREEFDTVSQQIREITDSDTATDSQRDKQYFNLGQRHAAIERELGVVTSDLEKMHETEKPAGWSMDRLNVKDRFLLSGTKHLGADEIKSYVVPNLRDLVTSGFNT